MANTAVILTGQPTPTGRIACMLHTPPLAATKKCPLLIYLHGVGESRPEGTASSASIMEFYSYGPIYWTREAGVNFPNTIHPITGETFQFYTMMPQQYAATAGNGGLWQNYYVTACIDYAKANLNVDVDRIYLGGFSLGGGGTWVAAYDPTINLQLAAIAPVSAGYGNASSLLSSRQQFAWSGLPCWAVHAANDTTTNPTGEMTTSQIVRSINTFKPTVSPKLWMPATGGHTFAIPEMLSNPFTMQSRVLDTGNTSPNTLNCYEWFLLYKRRVSLPYHPDRPV